MQKQNCLHKYDSSDIKHLTIQKIKIDRKLVITENKNGITSTHGLKQQRKQAFLDGLVKFETQELGSKYIESI